MKSSIPWGNEENLVEMPSPTQFLGKRKFDPKVLSKHCIIVGETGGGKTVSGIVPVMKGFYNHTTKDGLKYFMFVVDPKKELMDVLIALDDVRNEGRVVDVMNESNLNKLNPFEGLNQYRCLSDKMEYYFNVFGSGSVKESKNAIFRDGGLAELRAIADLEEEFYKQTGDSLLTLLTKLYGVDYVNDPSLADGLHLYSKKGVSGSRIAHEQVKWYEVEGNPEKKENDYSVFDLIEIILNKFAPRLESRFSDFFVYQNACKDLTNRHNLEQLQQLSYKVSYWSLMLDSLRSERYKNVFDLNAALGDDGKQLGQISEWIDTEKILVVTPIIGSETDEMVVLNLKRLIFNGMLTRSNMLAPMAYLADEFHNFISTDEESGEHNFLDRCRSYRVSCVLATQSLASLRAKATRQNGHTGDEALQSMLNNISNRIIFRTTDITTNQMMRNWLEKSPDKFGRHVLDNYPLTNLEVGECYWIRDKNWDREKITLPNYEKSTSHQPCGLAIN